MSGDRSDAQSVIHPSALSLSLFHKHILALSQDEFISSAEYGDKAGAAIGIQHR